MANGKASKKRRQAVREGKRDPQLDRLGWYGIQPVERKTPTLQERSVKSEKKYKPRWSLSGELNDGAGSILICG